MNNSLIYIHVVQISNLDVIVRGLRGLYNDLDMSEESAIIYRLRLALTLKALKASLILWGFDEFLQSS